MWEFDEAPFRREILNLLKKNFEKPTVVQSITWPIAMAGRDVISIAKTGSGKTLAVCILHKLLLFSKDEQKLFLFINFTLQFMLPGLMHTVSQNPRQNGDGPSILVLLPTRELAQQVKEVSVDYCHALGVKVRNFSA